MQKPTRGEVRAFGGGLAALAATALVSFAIAQVTSTAQIPAEWFWIAWGAVALGVATLLLSFVGKNKDAIPSTGAANDGITGPRGDLSLVSIPATGGPTMPVLGFRTQGRRDGHENTPSRPRALRFTLPMNAEGITVREGNLPAEIPCGAGKLVIKRFADTEVIFDEIGTDGEEVRAEIYYERRQRHESSTEWVIQHDWGLRPNVRLFDAEGNEVEADISHRDPDSVRVGFGQPQSGVSICIESRHQVEIYLDPATDRVTLVTPEEEHEGPASPVEPPDLTTAVRSSTSEGRELLERAKKELVDQMYPPSLKELLQRKLDEGYRLLENVPSWAGDISKSFSGIPVTTEAHVDNWTFQVEALLTDDPKRLAIFRIPRPFDALKTLATLAGGSPLRDRLEHELHQLEEIIKGLP